MEEEEREKPDSFFGCVFVFDVVVVVGVSVFACVGVGEVGVGDVVLVDGVVSVLTAGFSN